MKPTDEESADLKHRLRTLPCTDALIAEAEEFTAEQDEAIEETEKGLIPARPGSYVARILTQEARRVPWLLRVWRSMRVHR